MAQIAAIDAECEKIGELGIKLKLERREWTGYEEIRAREWLVLADSRSSNFTRKIAWAGVVLAIASLIVSLMK